MAEAEEATEDAGGEGKKKSKLLLIIALIVGILLVGGGGAAVAFFLLGSEPETAENMEPAKPEKADAIYTKVRTKEGKPMFVVTLQSQDQRPHYMQLYVEAKSREQQVADALELHMPLVVARLNALFQTQRFQELQSIEGKIALRQAATDLVRELMQEKIGKPGVETILFTNFVMQ
ncbi:flagellar basal body-associated FliL family protein [Pontibacter sp. JAM-7]|uniref:flagellar basal body-associated FliL family protein n=1 Tax=Pontibacter sp. JAM-7 TaxID=3366581 RepID=UPI003AF61C1B